MRSQPRSAGRGIRRRLPLLLAPDPSIRRLLVADPDTGRRTVLAARLQASGHQVETVSDRRSLLRVFADERPDLLLAAAQWGRGLVGELRAIDPGRLCPLIVYAGAPLGDALTAALLREGADDVVIHGDRVAEFDARVAVQLRNRADRELLAWTTHKVGELRDVALLDPLTGIANRRAADTAIQDALGAGGPTMLALVDLDHFKLVNDTCGHPVGDVVLRATAHALQRASRRRDLVARYGGEEFIVVLPDSDVRAAEAIGERLRIGVRELQFAPELGVLRISASVGVGCWDGAPPAPSPASLVDLTDRALYAAKNLGRDRVVVMRWAAGETGKRDVG